MKKYITFILILIIHFAFCVDEQDFRKRFYESVESAKVAKTFILDLQANTNSTHQILVDGYLAATNMVMAKHVFNPYSKFKYFLEGKKLLEKTLEKHPNHTELRLIRFAIQTNIPSFLGYNKEINNDKLFLLHNLFNLVTKSENEIQLKKIIKEYLIKSGLCTSTEILKINHS